MTITVVSDASPLIYFAKMNALELLAQVLGPVSIPPAVYRETVEAGRRLREPDANRIAKAVEGQILARLTLTGQETLLADRISADPRLGRGECEVIACAALRRFKALLHDKKARRIASAYNVPTMQAADVLFLALLRRHISLKKFKILLRHLAALTGINSATLLEREALAEEIAIQLNIQE